MGKVIEFKDLSDLRRISNSSELLRHMRQFNIEKLRHITNLYLKYGGAVTKDPTTLKVKIKSLTRNNYIVILRNSFRICIASEARFQTRERLTV